MLLHEHGQCQPLPTWHTGSPSPALLRAPGPQSAGPTQIPRRAVGSHPTCAPVHRAGAPPFLDMAKQGAPALCCTRAEAHGGRSSDPTGSSTGRGDRPTPHTGQDPMPGEQERRTGLSPEGTPGRQACCRERRASGRSVKGPEARACWCEAQDGGSRGKGGGREEQAGVVQ